MTSVVYLSRFPINIKYSAKRPRPKAEVHELYMFHWPWVQFNLLNDYTECVKVVTLHDFLLEIIKHWALVDSDNMDNISHRAVIHYFGLKGLTPMEFHDDMVVTLGESATSYNMGNKWDADSSVAGESRRRPPSEKASHSHHTGDHCQDSWHHHE